MPQALLKSRVWTEYQLREAQHKPYLADRLGHRLNDNFNGLVLPQGGILALASTQPKKIHDAKNILEANKAGLDVLDPIEILHWFQSADEKSKTFIGNAYEKAEHILNRIYITLGYEKVAARLRERGYDPSRVVFCVNDCGAYFNTDYSGEPEFARSLKEKGLGPWPGVEFGPVTDAQGGQMRFFSDLRQMTARKEAAGETVDLTGQDHQTYLLFRLEPNREHVRLFSFEAAVPIEFTTKPAPANDDVLTSFHFSKATDSILPPDVIDLTRAEFGLEYLQKYSAESRALNELVRVAHVPKRRFDSVSHHTSFNHVFTVASHLNVLPVSQPATFTDVPEGLRIQTHTYDTSKNGAYQQLTGHSNAILLGAHTAQISSNWDNHFLDLFDMWSSLIVDKQVRVETFQDKPFVVLNRKNPFTHDGRQNGDLDWDDPEVEKHFVEFMKNLDPKDDPWLQFVLFTRYLHEKGFVKQEPRFLHTLFEPMDPALRQFLSDAFRDSISKTQYIPEYEPEFYGQDETGLFEVTILGSASTRVADYTEGAFDLGFWTLEQGWHGRTGGGRYGVMGHYAAGALRYLDNNKYDSHWGHFSAIQMPRTLQFEGVCLEPTDLMKEMAEQGCSKKFLYVATGFDQRIRSLARSHAIVAMAAGMGTYQEIIRICRLKEAGDPAFADKNIILVNQKQPGSDLGVFDLFLSMLPERYKEHLIVVPTIAAAKREILVKHEDYLGTRHYDAFRPSL